MKNKHIGIVYLALALSLLANLAHWGRAVPPDYDATAGGATAPVYKFVTPTVGTTYAASRGFLIDDTTAGTLVYLDGEGTSQTVAHFNTGQLYGIRITKVVSYSGTAGAVRLAY